MKVMKVSEIEFMDGDRTGERYVRFSDPDSISALFIKVSPNKDFSQPVDVYNVNSVKRFKNTEWIFTGKAEETATA